MRSLLEGRRVLITGGGRGIGRAIALAFASEGADVAVAFSRHVKAAEETADEIRHCGRRAVVLQADLADPQERRTLVPRAADSLGVLDVLVNNAAFLTRRAFLDIPEHELDRVLSVDLVAPFILTQDFAHQRVEHGGGGVVLNIGSISSTLPSGNLAHYECAKAGLAMFTRSAALGLAEYGIRVNALLPGLTRTDGNRDQWEGDPQMWRKRTSPIPLGRAGEPADHAGAAVFLVSDHACYVTGASLVVDGGLLTRL